MKRTLLLLCLFTASITFAQVTAGQVDDFQDGTTQGWQIGAANPNGPVNVPDSGPNGAGDNAIAYSSGNNPLPPRMVIFNQSANWSGDYTAESIVAIKFDARVTGSDLNLRVAFQGGAGRTCTANAVTVTAGSGWTQVIIPISASDFSLAFPTAGTSIPNILNSVTRFRILSNTTPDWLGEVITATLEVDNVQASTTLSNPNFQEVTDFRISPNPSSSRLNISLPSIDEVATLEVFNVLGKRMVKKELSALQSSVNVSGWNSGVYIVKVSTDNTSQTKRFVKN